MPPLGGVLDWEPDCPWEPDGGGWLWLLGGELLEGLGMLGMLVGGGGGALLDAQPVSTRVIDMTSNLTILLSLRSFAQQPPAAA